MRKMSRGVELGDEVYFSATDKARHELIERDVALEHARSLVEVVEQGIARLRRQLPTASQADAVTIRRKMDEYSKLLTELRLDVSVKEQLMNFQLDNYPVSEDKPTA